MRSIVTGAANGIGKAVVAALSGYIIPLDLEWGHDVTQPDTYQGVIYNSHPDLLVHCAGVAGGMPFHEMTPEEWHRVVDTNLTGTYYIVRDVGKQMVEQRNGHIILIGSISALVANGPEFANAHYCASKAAIHGLARSLAIEWAKYNVRVNVVAPGLTYTPMVAQAISEGRGEKIAAFEKRHPMGASQSEDIAQAVLYLAGTRNVTGTTLVVDGGYTAQ